MTHLYAILIALLGFSAFVGSDTVMKWLGGDYSTYTLIFWYNFFVILAYSSYITYKKMWRNLISRQTILMHVIRGLCSVCLVLINVYAVTKIPLDLFYAIQFTAPIITTLLAILLLKERVSLPRWLAIIIGFIGVLIITNPDGRFDPMLAFFILGPAAFSLGNVITRIIPKGDPVVTYAFVPHFLQLITSIILGVYFTNHIATIPDTHDLLLLIGTSAFILVGGLSMSIAFLKAPAAHIAPIHYVQMVWAIALGFFLFSDTPTWQTLGGAGLIIISGLIIAWREAKIAQNTKIAIK